MLRGSEFTPGRLNSEELKKQVYSQKILFFNPCRIFTKYCMNTWAEFLFRFYTNLNPPENLPDDVRWLYPQGRQDVLTILKVFLQKYYADDRKRVLLLGINPGRYGAGITGINFTAPKQLKEICGIDNPFSGTELSAEFIYKMIEAYGGVKRFYSNFFISSVCPLGFVQHGKNLNYYDDRRLLDTIEPFMIENLTKLVSFNVNREICICIGGEKNFKYLSALNNQYHWFQEIVSLPHPRFIMQYKRKFLDDHISHYLKVLKDNRRF